MALPCMSKSPGALYAPDHVTIQFTRGMARSDLSREPLQGR